MGREEEEEGGGVGVGGNKLSQEDISVCSLSFTQNAREKTSMIFDE